MAIRSSQLRVEVEERVGARQSLSITVPPEVVRAEREKAVKRVARRLRKRGEGRVSAAAVERRFASDVQKEMLARVVADACRTALSDSPIQPMSQGEVESVDYAPELGVTFRISFDVQPEVEVARMGGFTVRRPSLPVGEKDVDEAIERLRVEQAIWRPAEDDGKPRRGDLVTVRILPADVGGGPPGGIEGDAGAPQPAALEDLGLPWARQLRLREHSGHRGRFQLVLGEGDAVPPLEEAIRALAPGDTREFAVVLDRGQERWLRITLEDRRVRDLPDLDDLFVQSLGDFADVAALRERVRAELEAAAAARSEAAVRTRLLDRLIDANPFEVPRALVVRHAESMLGDTGGAEPSAVERARAKMLPEAERAVKRAVVIERVAEVEELEATPDEVEARVAEIAGRGGVDPVEVRRQLVQSDRMEGLAREITAAKVIEFLKSRSRILEDD